MASLVPVAGEDAPGDRLRMEQSTSKTYDVFLAHGSGDKPAVRELYDKLTEAGFSVFLDIEEIPPGLPWRAALEDGLRASRSLAYCLGAAGPGPWTDLELSVGLTKNRNDPLFAVIPIWLRGATRRRMEDASTFLSQFEVVDLRVGIVSGPALTRLEEILWRVRAGSYIERSSARLPLGEIQDRVERLQKRFFRSLRPHLAGGELIHRKETSEVLKQLDDGATRVVMVHGVAGSGKSGVLLEVTETLAEDGVPFLPLRLDRLTLRADPRRFSAQELQLPESPARCLRALAEERDAVLVIDQLDALRWTSSHSAEAWDVCREMMEEALATPGLKLVVCCRTVDLDHDPQLRAWEKKSEYLSRVAVNLLEEEDVSASFRRFVGDGDATLPVRARELQLLRHVQHLQMWLAILESRGRITAFDTSWGLLQQFWATRRDALIEGGLTQERVEETEHRLVQALEGGAVLSAPVRKLDMSAEELDRFQTLHLLQVDETRAPPVFTFAHQSYQDFLVAKHLLQRLDRSSSRDTENEIRLWLGSRESQSLFRREQLRLVLTALRAEEHAAYLPVLKSLVPPQFPKGPSRLRFHLRLLALQFLSQQDEPLAAEKELCARD